MNTLLCKAANWFGEGSSASSGCDPMMATYVWCHLFSSAFVGGSNSESSDWSIRLDIFKTFSFTLPPPTDGVLLVTLVELWLASIGLSSQTSTSTNASSDTPPWNAITRLANRQTNPTWVAWSGENPAPSGMTATPAPATTAGRERAATKRRSSRQSPTWFRKACQTSSLTWKKVSASVTVLIDLSSSHRGKRAIRDWSPGATLADQKKNSSDHGPFSVVVPGSLSQNGTTNSKVSENSIYLPPTHLTFSLFTVKRHFLRHVFSKTMREMVWPHVEAPWKLSNQTPGAGIHGAYPPCLLYSRKNSTIPTGGNSWTFSEAEGACHIKQYL